MSNPIHLALAALAAVAAWLWLIVACGMNHDVAGVLHFADRLVGGERLYEDMVDVNPPLAFLLSVPPAWAARVSGLPVAASFGAYVSLLLATSLWACWRALAAHTQPWAATFTVAAAVALGPGAAGMIGQREHLMLLMVLPWACLLPARLAGRSGGTHEAALGAAAALGMCLKPPFLLIGATVEGFALARLGWRAWIRRPGPWAVAATGLAYAAVVVLAFPAYLDRVVPWLLGPYQSLGHLGPLEVLADPRLLVALAAAGVASVCWRRLPDLGRILVPMAAAAAASAALQGKGWPYHLLPAATFAGLALATLLAASPRPGRAIAGVVAVLLACLPLHERGGWLPRESGDAVAQIERFLATERGRVLVVSPMLSPLFPGLLESDATDLTPAMTAWQVQAAQACPGSPEPTDEDRESADWFRDRLKAALVSGVDLILVDPVPLRPDCPGATTFPVWLRSDPMLAPLLARFRNTGRVWRLEVWRRF